jgi:hypothetical protein
MVQMRQLRNEVQATRWAARKGERAAAAAEERAERLNVRESVMRQEEAPWGGDWVWGRGRCRVWRGAPKVFLRMGCHVSCVRAYSPHLTVGDCGVPCLSCPHQLTLAMHTGAGGAGEEDVGGGGGCRGERGPDVAHCTAQVAERGQGVCMQSVLKPWRVGGGGWGQACIACLPRDVCVGSCGSVVPG